MLVFQTGRQAGRLWVGSRGLASRAADGQAICSGSNWWSYAWWLAYKSSRSPELAEDLLGTKKTGSSAVGSSKIHMVVLVRVYGAAWSGSWPAQKACPLTSNGSWRFWVALLTFSSRRNVLILGPRAVFWMGTQGQTKTGVTHHLEHTRWAATVTVKESE